MKKGLKVGDSTILEVKVTEDMFAQFDGELIHPAYSTASMVYHMEWASRNLLIPHLEANEESAGAAVKLKHVAPSALGTNVKVKAVVINVTDKQVMTEVTVKNESAIIGVGEIKQIIMPENTMQSKLDAQLKLKNEGTGGNFLETTRTN
ncbi:hypothetical protein J18TS1_35520 [Oceanobacillus oncorhynchi subsp. incaldanensis]|uniref:Thioesterase family protein n=1 Tax=Oceanobacillus aidingensis TaxID=645964 RepID=A0ABV9K366_9BACI|nr:thioesterase [Oceanobacillus oncorhynchi]MDM8099813.1 thioesterase [Oceanobacillus oncorhynchi]GIO20452.1 hypothetical protein J18TS1_35520 [Oceanobacillus oncorhynchi subsp. incaldanensis]